MAVRRRVCATFYKYIYTKVLPLPLKIIKRYILFKAIIVIFTATFIDSELTKQTDSAMYILQS